MLKNMFTNNEWLKIHLKEIKEKAGPRYTPELNIEIPIAEIFDGISRTRKFYELIRKHCGKLSREFRYLTSKYKENELQESYKKLKNEIDLLFNLLRHIKEYNTKTIPWDDISEHVKKSQELSWDLMDKLRVAKEKIKDNGKSKKEHTPFLHSEKIDSDIHYLYETQKELHYFEELALSTKGQLSNCPFLLITGSAGTGKTHLLCDIAEDRIKNNLPGILVFGEFFYEGLDAWQQIINQLAISEEIDSKEKFLRQLDEAGKKTQCRSLLIIDALNETRPLNFWKDKLNNLIEEVRKYPNIALVISIRSGFENKVLNKEQKRLFVHEEHQGFRFKEWEAVTKFFNEFSLPLPEVPLLMPEFQNPLFLLLFCQAFQRRAKENQKRGKQRQIFKGHEGATYIFENFVKEMADKIASEFGLPKGRDKNGDYVIWDTIIEKIAAEMAEQNEDRITEEKLKSIISSTYPSIDTDRFIQALERNLLIVKVPRYSKDFNKIERFDYRFPFQKFSDHLIGRYIFKKFRNSGKTPEDFFAEETGIGKLIKWNRGLVEALSIQCPEQLRGQEFVDVAPYLKDSYTAQEAFIESLIWRNPKAFLRDLKNTTKFINEKIIRTESGHNQLLNAFLSVAPIPEHSFNAEFLHNHLSKFSMPERDSWWSIFLHYQYGEHGAVDRLIEWAWSEQDKSHIRDDSTFLTAIALSWFLTTPNRFVRDKSTKALVSLLQNRIHLIPKLLKKFKDMNDPYVSERLFAVAYGCVLRNQEDSEGLKELAKRVYENIFKDNNLPVHILLRDYARGVIEIALRRGIKLNIEKDKINPPYQSKWPKQIPLDNEIKKYEFDYKSGDFKDYYWSQNTIISSMQPGYTTIKHYIYGDFGRYVFQSGLSHWDTGEITVQQLSNFATKMIFDELGYNVELHGEFDRNVNYHCIDRSAHKSERIGKKYQWISFHKILALVSDHFNFKGDIWSDSIERYKGPWNPYVRDIDSSFILRNDNHIKQIATFKTWKSTHGYYNAWTKEKSDLDWIKTRDDLPSPEDIIQINDGKGQEWLMLEGSVKWEEEIPPEHKKYDIPVRELWYMIKSYIVKKENIEKIFKWAKKQNFMGGWMPESHDFYEIFLGEYPNSLAFEDLRGDFNIWTKEGRGETNDLSVPVVVTDDSYLNELTYDYSHYGSISIKLPCKWLVNKMKLNHKYLDGRWFDKEKNLVVFTTSIFEENFLSALLINKRLFYDFLDKNEYAVFWTLLGEKQMLGGSLSGKEWIGRLEISGAYTLNPKDPSKIRGEFKCKFKN